MLDWIKRYQEQGFALVQLHSVNRGVCSCKKGDSCPAAGKHPIRSNWTKQPETYRTDWLGHNVGIVTGAASGVTVLDVDGPEGEASLKELENDFGPLPEGPRQRTGGGGRHFLFKYVPLKNLVKFKPGLDIRSDNGQIVAAPSMHKSGTCYAWEYWDCEVPEMPAWLVSVITGNVAKLPPFDFADWASRQPISISGENGSGQAMRMAAKAVRAGGISTEDAFLTQVQVWNEKCEPPWSDDELIHKFRDAVKSFESEGGVLGIAKAPQGGKATQAALTAIVREDVLFKGHLRTNDLGDYMEYKGERLTDEMVLTLRTVIRERFGYKALSKDMVFEALVEECSAHHYSPVKDYLEGLRWDGQKRLDTLGRICLGGATDLDCVMVKRWLLGAVYRAMSPGCDFQTALVLAGAQGIGKSSFFRILGRPWFSDTSINLESKDAFQAIANTWIYEWQELDTMYRSKESSAVKAFLSSCQDTYRPPYGRLIKNYPRRCVIGGSTNDAQCLPDRTGSRRFFMVECHGVVDRGRMIKGKGVVDCDLGWLTLNRDQVWAEAVAGWRASEPCHLLGVEDAAREEANERFVTESPLYEAAVELLQNGTKVTYTTREVATRLGMDNVRLTPMQNRDICQAFTDLGYVFKRTEKSRTWVRLA